MARGMCRGLRLGKKGQAGAEDKARDEVDGEREAPGYVLAVGRATPECHAVAGPDGGWPVSIGVDHSRLLR